MPSLNRIVLIGRLTADPTLNYTASNLPVASFTVAVDRPTSKNQDKKTDFFRCKAWRQKADFVSQYVQKGRLVAVEGRVELNEYTGQDGQRKFTTDVVVDHIETLDSQRDGQGGRRQDQADDGYSGGAYPDDMAGPDPGPGAEPRANSGRATNGISTSRSTAPAAAPPPRAAAPRASAPKPAASRPAPAQYPEDDFDDSDPFADE